MAETDFLVTLPSNSNMKTHPGNEPSNYTVKLSKPLSLTGDWEAALVSVQYTPTWMTLQNRLVLVVFGVEDPMVDINFLPPDIAYQKHIRVFEKFEREVAVPNTTYTEISRKLVDMTNFTVQCTVVQILPQYFATPNALGDEICRVVNKSLHDSILSIRYDYDFASKRGCFVVSGGTLSLYAENSTILGDLLGHDSTWVPCGMCPTYDDRRAHNSPHFCKLNPAGNRESRLPKVNAWMVYTNITEYQQVGDTAAPLLGIIPTQGSIGQRSHYTVNPVHFLAVTCSHIPEITICMRDDKGKRIPFQHGSSDDNVVCCLRFRRRKTQLL